MDDYVFDKSIFCFIQRFEFYTTLIVKELLYNKNQFFTSISKSVVTYINITVTNISNNIIKQYYGMIKMFKVLVIVRKKQFSRTNIFIQDRSIMLNKQAFFDFKNIFMMSICQDGKLVKGWDIITIQKMVKNYTFFDGLTFLNVKGDILICSPDLTFKFLSVSP